MGGAQPRLEPDGWIGPLTIGAIEDFQKLHFPDKRADGRIDVHPGAWTIWRLRTILQLTRQKGNGGVVEFWRNRKALRLARIQLLLRDVHNAAAKSVHAASLALDALDGAPDFTGVHAAALKRASLHFKLDGLHADAKRAALQRVREVMMRIRIQLETFGPQLGGIPYGAAVFDVDAHDLPYLAYSPRREDGMADGMDPYKVYVCDPFDRVSDDRAIQGLVHEMAHSVDDETPAFSIRDHGYASQAFRIPHALRMKNAENYSLYAAHVFLGRQRFVALHPSFPALVPEGS